MTSAGLLVGLGLVEVTGVVAFDAITALLIAVAIVAAGIRILSRSSRILVDEAPPPEELDRIEQAIASAGMPEIAGYHKLRARRSGATATSTSTSSSAPAPRSSARTSSRTSCAARSRTRSPTPMS